MISFFRRYKLDILAIAFFTAVAFIFMGAALRPEEGRILYGFDLERLFHPFGDFMFRAFRDGKLPLWNPYVFLGFPQYAEPQLATFYPLTWPMAWLPAPLAFPLQYTLHFAWAGIGGYALIRQLGGKRGGAALTGFGFAYMLTMMVRIYVGHMPHIMTLSWVPWILAAAYWAALKRTWQATIIAGAPLGLAFLIGYIPFLIYIIPALSLFMLWLAYQAYKNEGAMGGARVVAQLVGIGLFAATLAAVQLLPSMEFTLHSNRAAARYNFANSYPIEFNQLLTLVMPDIFGAPTGATSYWLNLPETVYWEWAMYVGVLPLILFALAWPYGRKAWRFWVALGGLGLLMALGDAGAFHRVLYDFAPGVDSFRFVGRAIYFFDLAAVILMGLMFDRWFDAEEETAVRQTAVLKKFLNYFLPFMLGLILISVFWQAAQAGGEQIGMISGITSQLVRLLLLAGASLALLIWGHGRSRWLLTALAMTILLVDLWGVGNKFIVDQRDEPELGWIMADIALPENRRDYRVLSRDLPENDGYYFGFYALYGYDGFTLEASETFNDLSAWDARIARLLSARYLLHGPEWEMPITAPGWETLTQPAGVTIYERADAGERAFIVHDVIGAESGEDALAIMARPEIDFTQTAVVQIVPDTTCAIEPAKGSTAVITDYQPQQATIQTESTAGGWLVLNDVDYPGWGATLDGTAVPIQPTNYALRGVCVPAGSHEVIFTFAPSILRYGAMATLAALVLLVTAVVTQALSKKRQKWVIGQSPTDF